MSRTFSFDAALTCGIDQADRDYLVIMASDLQDPPEVIHDLLREIEKGFDQVVVHVAKREHVPLVRRTLSNVFYRFNYWATDGLVPKNVSDYRIMSRRLYLNVLKLRENHRFMRGLSAWAGFKTSSISIARPHRFAGKSKWLDSKFFAVVATAIRATLAFSIKPLLIVSLITFLLGLISFLSLIPLSFFFLINGVPFGGFGTLIGFAILTFGTIMITLSIISLYLTLIYEETRNRPIYVIETATF